MTTSPVLETVVLCVDGSGEAEQAVHAGFALLAPVQRVVVVTVVEASDPTLVTGTGMAGGVISVEEYEELDKEAAQEGWAHAPDRAAKQLGLRDPEIHVLADLRVKPCARSHVRRTHGPS